MNPIMQQWSFTVEQQLSNDWAVRASYVGAQTHHMFWYAGDINKPNVQKPNVPLQAQRPYQPWGQINATQGGGNINFDQLQLELNKRFANGLLFQAQYQFTRSLDNVSLTGGPQNPNNYAAEYGNTDSVPRQVLTLNYLYELPVGHGRRINLQNRLVDSVLGGWSVSGITVYRTGIPVLTRIQRAV